MEMPRVRGQAVAKLAEELLTLSAGCKNMIKVPPQIMTSYNRIANEWPVYTLIDAMVKFMLASHRLFYRMTL